MEAAVRRTWRHDVARIAERAPQVRHYVLATWRVPRRRNIAASLLLAIVSAVAFARVTEDYLTLDPLARWDLSFARWLADNRSLLGTDIFRVVTDVGSPAVAVVIAALVCVVLYRRRAIADAALLPLVLGGAELLNVALKLAFHRTRPEVAAVHLDTYSYPSGHAMVATAAYGAFAVLLWKRAAVRNDRAPLVLALALAIGLVSFSRLYLGVHYLSDVLGGISAGAAWLGVALAVRFAAGGAFAAWFEDSPLDRAGRWLTRS